MKKRIQKSLKLNRETLTSLNWSDLREPLGMGTTLCTDTTNWTCAWIRTQCVGY
jgi:hypothetical protein